MAKPTVKQNADNFEVSVAVAKADLPTQGPSWKMAEILQKAHRDILTALQIEQEAGHADTEIARLTDVKTQVIAVPAQIGP